MFTMHNVTIIYLLLANKDDNKVFCPPRQQLIPEIFTVVDVPADVNSIPSKAKYAVFSE